MATLRILFKKKAEKEGIHFPENFKLVDFSLLFFTDEHLKYEK